MYWKVFSVSDVLSISVKIRKCKLSQQWDCHFKTLFTMKSRMMITKGQHCFERILKKLGILFYSLPLGLPFKQQLNTIHSVILSTLLQCPQLPLQLSFNIVGTWIPTITFYFVLQAPVLFPLIHSLHSATKQFWSCHSSI